MPCDTTQVGQYAHTLAVMLEDKLRGLSGIVGYHDGVDPNTCKLERNIAIKGIAGKFLRAVFKRAKRSMDGYLIAMAQSGDAGNMIAVFMANQNRGEVAGTQLQSSQALLGLFQIKPAVHQKYGVANGHEGSITPTAAS